MAEGNPFSFLHVIRPEIDLGLEVDEHDDAVYERGARNLRLFADASHTLEDDAPAAYVYRLVMHGRTQTGIFACVSVDEYNDGTILRHEKTRQDKEDDRTRHILIQRAHAEPVMLTYRDDGAVDRIIARAVTFPPLYDFVAGDEVRHTMWKIDTPSPLVDAFREVERLYVADGHHRCKAASRVVEALTGEGRNDDFPEARFFPAVLFPMSQMRILAYNRIIRRVPSGVQSFLEDVARRMPLERGVSMKVPDEPGRVCIYGEGLWNLAALPDSSRSTEADELDVARLGEHVLEPILGIRDVRTDRNIDFIGGIRGTAELERLVDTGAADVAVSMHPTSIEELVRVSDAGQLMPPKSTWFEPKLRSGLLVHRF